MILNFLFDSMSRKVYQAIVPMLIEPLNFSSSRIREFLNLLYPSIIEDLFFKNNLFIR